VDSRPGFIVSSTKVARTHLWFRYCAASCFIHATAIAFLSAYGELAIGFALVLGVFVRSASICGAIYMLALLFASNYPGVASPLWEYFGAALDHLVLVFCFVAFAAGETELVLSLSSYRRHKSVTRRAA